MSACRRKYAALGMAGRPRFFLQRPSRGTVPDQRHWSWSFSDRPRRSVVRERAAVGGARTKGGARPNGQCRDGVSIPLLSDAHGLLERPPHLGWLAVAVPKCLQARLEQGIFLVVLERDPFDAL